VRFLIIVSSILLLTLVLFTPSFASVATKHGCAPETPPAVPGALVQPTAARGTLFINEALLTPHSTWNCSELGVYNPTSDAWLEIYNPQNQPLDLYSVHTSIDSGPNTNLFYLPLGSAIAPYGFLVVFPRLDSGFLATETTTWRLLIGGVPVDEVALPMLGEDQSYARVPDGSSTWIITSASTIGASNTTSVLSPAPTKTKVEATATARSSGGNKGSGGNHEGVGKNRGDSGSGGSTSGNGSSTDTGNRQQQVDGAQPTWNSLKHPTTVVASTSPAVTQSSNSVLQASSNDLDISHKILLTLLVIAFAGALLWCWRLFRAP